MTCVSLFLFWENLGFLFLVCFWTLLVCTMMYRLISFEAFSWIWAEYSPVHITIHPVSFFSSHYITLPINISGMVSLEATYTHVITLPPSSWTHNVIRSFSAHTCLFLSYLHKNVLDLDFIKLFFLTMEMNLSSSSTVAVYRGQTTGWAISMDAP